MGHKPIGTLGEWRFDDVSDFSFPELFLLINDYEFGGITILSRRDWTIKKVRGMPLKVKGRNAIPQAYELIIKSYGLAVRGILIKISYHP